MLTKHQLKTLDRLFIIEETGPDLTLTCRVCNFQQVIILENVTLADYAHLVVTFRRAHSRMYHLLINHNP